MSVVYEKLYKSILSYNFIIEEQDIEKKLTNLNNKFSTEHGLILPSRDFLAA